MCHLQSSWERLTARVRHRRCACVQTHPRLKDAIARGIQEEIQLPPGTYKLIEKSYTKTTKHTSAYSYPGVSAFSRSTSPNRPNLALPAGSISLRASVRGGVCVCVRARAAPVQLHESLSCSDPDRSHRCLGLRRESERAAQGWPRCDPNQSVVMRVQPAFARVDFERICECCARRRCRKTDLPLARRASTLPQASTTGLGTLPRNGTPSGRK